jgi:hypothetical protein
VRRGRVREREEREREREGEEGSPSLNLCRLCRLLSPVFGQKGMKKCFFYFIKTF